MERIQNRTHLAFTLPALLMVSCVLFFPILYDIYLSFFNIKLIAPNRPLRFLGLENYMTLFRDAHFLKALRTTVSIGLLCVAIQIVLGMCLALLFERKRRFGRALPGLQTLRGVMMLPYLMMPVMIGTMWKLIMDPSFGFLYRFVTQLGLPRVTYFSDPAWSFWMIILIDTWQCTPMVMLILSAGLKTIDETLYEAAHVDGANRWQNFWRITLPSIRPSLKVALSVRLMDVLRIYDTIFASTKGGPGDETTVLSIYVYNKAFLQYETSRAAAAALVVTVLILLMSLVVIKGLANRD